jgi:hypothetical protein
MMATAEKIQEREKETITLRVQSPFPLVKDALPEGCPGLMLTHRSRISPGFGGWGV